MAILFEWYENPVAPNQSQEETKLHARITLNGKTGTDRLRRKIQERCSLTETDVSAVLDALSHAMGEELAEGRQVHLDGIGYFHPTLTCTEEIKEDTKRKNTKVRLKGIKFRKIFLQNLHSFLYLFLRIVPHKRNSHRVPFCIQICNID